MLKAFFCFFIGIQLFVFFADPVFVVNAGSCPGRGDYCGGSVGQNSNYLYYCSGSGANPTLKQACSYGCEVKPPGYPDVCKSAPSGPCPGSGYYCGGSVGQNSNYLYYCSGTGANPSLSQQCSNGCKVNPPGTPDQCNPSLVDNAAYGGYETIPDGTDMSPNQGFSKVWRMRNSGTTTWTTSYKLAYESGTQMGGTTSVNLSSNVGPGGTIDISVPMTAPGSGSGIRSNWKMKNGNGNFFGDQVWVTIDVLSGPCPGAGDYCGGSVGQNASNLYNCTGTGANPTLKQTCGVNGCQVNPPGTADVCKPDGACPGAGDYCGGSVGQNASNLYNCTGTGANPTLKQTCGVNGCQVNPPGTPDVCKPNGACPGAGDYCGGSVGQNASNLYNCTGTGANPTLKQTCGVNGCQVNPPGTADVCKPTLSDGATYANYETIPDNTTMTKGQSFTKVWRMKNTGTTTWTTSYKLAYESGVQFGGSTSVNLSRNVAPNETIDITVSMIAPNSTGTQQSNWKLKNAAGSFFGDVVWVKLNVIDTSSTGACPSYGNYCGETVGQNPANLYSCAASGANPVSIQSCSNGCQVNLPGTPDVCAPANNGSGNFCETIPYNVWDGVGKYCNGDTLVTCSSDKRTTNQYACGAGNCKVNPPGTDDACIYASSTNFCQNIPENQWGGVGTYCNGDTLVSCSSNREVISEQYCGVSKCQLNPPGTADTCLNDSTNTYFCQSISADKWSGAGKYCNGSELVTCTLNRETLGSEMCNSGCQENSAGVADACKTAVNTDNFCQALTTSEWKGAGNYCDGSNVIACSADKSANNTICCAYGCAQDSSGTNGTCRPNPTTGKVIFPVKDYGSYKIEPYFGFAQKKITQWYDCEGNVEPNNSPTGKYYHAAIDIIHNTAKGTEEIRSDSSQADKDLCKRGGLNAVVVAIADGEIVEVHDAGNEGWRITIKHNINGQTIYSSYIHVQKDPSIRNRPFIKDEIQIGAILGTVGNFSHNPHLHFEIRKTETYGGGYSSYVNPLQDPNQQYLNPCSFMADNGAYLPPSCSNIVQDGGYYAAADNTVAATFPTGATSQDLLVKSFKVAIDMTPLTNNPNLVLIGNSYEMLAQNAQGDVVSNFNSDVSLGIKYDSQNLSEIDPASLKMYYYNTQSNTWELLTSTVDSVNNKVIASTNHFSEFAILGEKIIKPTITLETSHTSITPGETATLTWNVAGSQSQCTRSDGWDGESEMSGSLDVSPLSTTTYTLSCTNSAGIDTKSVTVTVSIPTHSVPGKIEAERFSNMSGVQLEDTTDTDGGKNVGYLETGDWMDYQINVGNAGIYTVEFRVASALPEGVLKGLHIKKSDGTTIGMLNIPHTGNWQNWTTIKTNLNLDAGIQTIRVYVDKPGWNINWMNFKLADLTENVELLSQPWNLTGSAGAAEKYQEIDPNILVGKDTLRVTYNLNGLKSLTGDASALIIDQNGWNYVSLSNYGFNGATTSQTVDIPLSNFGALNPNLPVGTLHTRFWYSGTFNVNITSIIAYNSRSTGTDTNAIVYRSATGVNGLNSPKLKFMNDSSIYGGEIELPSAGSPVRSQVLKKSPISNKMILITSSDDGYLDSYVCTLNCTNPSSWVYTSNVARTNGNPAQRRFDIEFETKTGDALLIYAITTTNEARDLAYKVLKATSNNFTGIIEQYLNDTGHTTDIIYYWPQLARNPRLDSEEIIFAGFDKTNTDVNGWVWNGSSWGNFYELTSEATGTGSREAHAIEYSKDGSKAIFVGSTGISGEVKSTYWNGTSWVDVGTFDVDSTDAYGVNWITLKASALTNDMQMVIVDAGRDLHTAYWNDTNWAVTTNIDLSVDALSYRAVDFMWIAGTNTGQLVWDTDATASTMATRMCSPVCNAKTINISTYGATGAWLSLYQNVTQVDKVQGVRVNSLFQIGAFTRNSGTYTNMGDNIITTGTALTTYEPYSMIYLK
jgi:hypothetical protein